MVGEASAKTWELHLAVWVASARAVGWGLTPVVGEASARAWELPLAVWMSSARAVGRAVTLAVGEASAKVWLVLSFFVALEMAEEMGRTQDCSYVPEGMRHYRRRHHHRRHCRRSHRRQR